MYRARWLFPAEGAPVENGVLVVSAGCVAEVTETAPSQAVDLGNAAIIPALVNAHTHLEFSGLGEPLAPPLPFTDWLRAVMAWRRAGPPAVDVRARGWAESVKAGTVLVGDIVSKAPGAAVAPHPGAALQGGREVASPHPGPPPQGGREVPHLGPALQGMERSSRTPTLPYKGGGGPCAGVAFLELIGLSQRRAAAELAKARAWLACADTDRPWRAGLSPHAPYSARIELVAEAARLCGRHGAAIAMHLAETRDELELLRSGGGPFRAFLEEMQAWDASAFAARARPLDYLRALEAAPRVVVAHGNYLDDAELRYLAARPEQMTVAYCPRTHAYFGHAAHPWRRLLEMGGSVALGTDSRASNPDLSLWGELQFLAARHTDFPRPKLLELGTLAAARSLGLEQEAGSLVAGKRAHAAVIALPDRAGDPYELLFDRASRVVATMLDGQLVQRVHSANHETSVRNLSMPDYTPYQKGIIRRYYENRETIARQKLPELVSNLYLATGKKRAKLWESAAAALQQLKVPQDRIEAIAASDDPARLAKLIEELEGRGG